MFSTASSSNLPSFSLSNHNTNNFQQISGEEVVYYVVEMCHARVQYLLKQQLPILNAKPSDSEKFAVLKKLYPVIYQYESKLNELKKSIHQNVTFYCSFLKQIKQITLDERTMDNLYYYFYYHYLHVSAASEYASKAAFQSSHINKKEFYEHHALEKICTFLKKYTSKHLGFYRIEVKSRIKEKGIVSSTEDNIDYASSFVYYSTTVRCEKENYANQISKWQSFMLNHMKSQRASIDKDSVVDNFFTIFTNECNKLVAIYNKFESSSEFEGFKGAFDELIYKMNNFVAIVTINNKTKKFLSIYDKFYYLYTDFRLFFGSNLFVQATNICLMFENLLELYNKLIDEMEDLTNNFADLPRMKEDALIKKYLLCNQEEFVHKVSMVSETIIHLQNEMFYDVTGIRQVIEMIAQCNDTRKATITESIKKAEVMLQQFKDFKTVFIQQLELEGRKEKAKVNEVKTKKSFFKEKILNPIGVDKVIKEKDKKESSGLNAVAKENLLDMGFARIIENIKMRVKNINLSNNQKNIMYKIFDTSHSYHLKISSDEIENLIARFGGVVRKPGSGGSHRSIEIPNFFSTCSFDEMEDEQAAEEGPRIISGGLVIPHKRGMKAKKLPQYAIIGIRDMFERASINLETLGLNAPKETRSGNSPIKA